MSKKRIIMTNLPEIPKPECPVCGHLTIKYLDNEIEYMRAISEQVDRWPDWKKVLSGIRQPKRRKGYVKKQEPDND